jgi:BTB/POZ domain
MVSQVALEAPSPQPAVLEAEPANLPASDDSFVRHETYFFNDGNITFSVRVALLCVHNSLTMPQVDGTLYCVHRYFFSRDSAYFSTKFSQLGVRDHESLNNVVSLGDVECKDFEAFLSVIYPE